MRAVLVVAWLSFCVGSLPSRATPFTDTVALAMGPDEDNSRRACPKFGNYNPSPAEIMSVEPQLISGMVDSRDWVREATVQFLSKVTYRTEAIYAGLKQVASNPNEGVKARAFALIGFTKRLFDDSDGEKRKLLFSVLSAPLSDSADPEHHLCTQAMHMIRIDANRSKLDGPIYEELIALLKNSPAWLRQEITQALIEKAETTQAFVPYLAIAAGMVNAEEADLLAAKVYDMTVTESPPARARLRVHFTQLLEHDNRVTVRIAQKALELLPFEGKSAKAAPKIKAKKTKCANEIVFGSQINDPLRRPRWVKPTR